MQTSESHSRKKCIGSARFFARKISFLGKLTYDHKYDYNEIMVKVNVAALKAELSHYLELVENGEQLLVTSHGKEIAKIAPAYAMNVAAIDWSDFMKKHPPIKPKSKGDDADKLMRKIRDEF